MASAKLFLLTRLFLATIFLASKVVSIDKCLVKIDLVILCDGSNSVSRTGFVETSDRKYYRNYVYKLLMDVIDAFPVSNDETHIGLIMFGSERPETWFSLTRFSLAEGMKGVFIGKNDSGPYYGQTYTDIGMVKAMEEFDKSGRKGVAKVLLLITDGEADNQMKANNASEELKRKNITIVTMGIGGSIKNSSLTRWATKPAYFMKSGFKDLKDHIEKLKETMCTAVKSEAPGAIIAPPKPNSNGKCRKLFPDSDYCWSFETEGSTRVQDEIAGAWAALYNGARIKQSGNQGLVLALLEGGGSATSGFFPYADMGDFNGTCVSDPDLCPTGITVMFWLKMTSEYIRQMASGGMTHQYIISSGGQKSDSRGFAFLYQHDASYNGFKLQLQDRSGDYVIEMLSIPESWFMFAMTFVKGAGMLYYENGRLVGRSTKISGTYNTDIQTHLTVGKPNYGDKYFGRLEMDNLVIWRRALTRPEVESYHKSSKREEGAKNDLGDAFKYASYVYLFDRITMLGGIRIVFEYLRQQKNAILMNGSSLHQTNQRGMVLSIQKWGQFVQVGNFVGECASDPEKCTDGLSVGFWIKITSEDLILGDSSPKDQLHQYIISSGGQVSTSRGFAFLYASEERKFKLQLQSNNSVYMIERDNIPEQWCHIIFTWKANEPLLLYINGEEAQGSIGRTASFPTDSHTLLTIGKPNHIDKHFGRFKLDQLVIFYRKLSRTEVKNVFDAPPNIGKQPVAADPTRSTPTASAKPSSSRPIGYDAPTTPTVFTPTKLATTGPTTVMPPIPTGVATLMPAIPTGFTTVRPPTPTGLTTLRPPIPTVTTTKVPSIPTGATLGTKAPTPTLQPPPPTIAPATLPNAPPTKIPAGSCTAKVDVVIIIDNSGSIEARDRDGYFEKVKLFVVNLMKPFPIGGTTRVAIIEAGNDAVMLARFGQVKSENDFKKLILNIQYKKQRSFIGKALELARRDVFAKIVCNNSAKMLITITDGYSNDEVKLVAQEIRDQGVKMVCIGFGSDTPFMRGTIQALSSEAKEQHAFILAYDRLLESVPVISRRACAVAMAAEKQFLYIDVDDNPVKGGVGPTFKQLFLDEINKYRRMHSAVPLVWSTELSLQAQRWAEYLADQKKLLPKPNIRYGQTLYESPKPGPVSAQIAVRAWYNQIIYYDFQHPRITNRNIYFAQLVWRASADVGVGMYKASSGKTYVVAFYSPSGSLDDAIGENILPITSSAVTSVDNGYCPEGYQANMEYCYKLHSETATWEEAVATCSAQKSALVSVTRDEENYFIYNILHTHTVKKTWLGLNDRLSEGSFTWVDGAPLSFNGWVSPPQMGGANQCVQLDTASGWQLVPCDTTLSFICKTIKPGDLLFTVTIHYPTQPWSDDLAYSTSPAGTELIQRVERLVMGIYDHFDWFTSYTIKAFRGTTSVYVDLELRFSRTAPIDPLEPFKVVLSSEDCESFICDAADMKIVPAINVTYNGSCSPSCYSSCSSICPASCCAPASPPDRYSFQAVTMPAAPLPPPPPPPSPVSQQFPLPAPPPPPMVISGLPQVSVSQTYPYYCQPACYNSCSISCPQQCCRMRRRRRSIVKVGEANTEVDLT